MITEDIENIRKNGFDVEEIPTDINSPGIVDRVRVNKETYSYINKPCEILQKIGKIKEIQVVDGEWIRIVILRAMIGSG